MYQTHIALHCHILCQTGVRVGELSGNCGDAANGCVLESRRRPPMRPSLEDRVELSDAKADGVPRPEAAAMVEASTPENGLRVAAVDVGFLIK